MADFLIGVRLNGDASSLQQATRTGLTAVQRFGQGVREELQRVQRFVSTTQGQLAGLGLSLGLVQMQRNAAMLDKTLTQIRLNAGMTSQEQVEAYRTMFELIRKNGGAMEETVGSFGKLTASGLKYKEAMESVKAIVDARAVSGANDNTLANALSVGSSNFRFDLSQAGVATTMLDKMVVAGRLGNAELENLSDIFARVATNAQTANMSFEQTLAFLEVMSKKERQPERLATLADSTLRVFTNGEYMKHAANALKVRFFEKDGSRRDPVAVLEDMRKKYAALDTDAKRFKFMQEGFGKADLDTRRGISMLLGGDELKELRQFTKEIEGAGGTIRRDLGTATSNAIDQTSRLKNTMREAAEEFASPVNAAIAKGIKHMLDPKADGGMGASGGQLAAAGAAGVTGLYAASRLLPGIVGKLVGRAGGMAAGVATGKMLQAAAGVTPVYVTNWAEMDGKSSALAELAKVALPSAAAAGMTGTAAIGLTAAGAALVGAPILGAGVYMRNRMNSPEGLRGRIADRNARLDELDQLMRLEREGGASPGALARIAQQRDGLISDRNEMLSRLDGYRGAGFDDPRRLDRQSTSEVVRSMLDNMRATDRVAFGNSGPAQAELRVRIDAPDGFRATASVQSAEGLKVRADYGSNNAEFFTR